MSLESLQDGSFFALHSSEEAGMTNKLHIRRRPSLALTCGPVASLLSDLEIGLSDQWNSFEHWLKGKLATLPPRAFDNDQQCWWQANGRAFRLLNLPFELRSMIYGHIIGYYLWPREEWDRSRNPPKATLRVFGYPHYKMYSERWRTFARTTQYTFDPAGNTSPGNMPIQFVCKQVRAEIRNFVTTSTVPHFGDLWTLTDAIDPFQGKWLRRISLGFPNSIYFMFLGFSDQRLMVSPDGPPIHVLRNIPTLAHLHLHFQVPTPLRIHKVANRGRFISQDPWTPSLRDYRANLISCQKTLLDWFFTLALEALRGIPPVSMSGHVKHSTRTKWEAILYDERNGTLHDFSVERQVIISDYLQRPL